MVLEGKEFEQKLGEYGSASVDVTGDLKIVAEAKVEIDLIKELEKVAQKTPANWDDNVVAALKGFLALVPKA